MSCRIILLILFVFMNGELIAGSNIQLHSLEDRIDVLIDGRLFTSYLYSADLPKPVLVPLTTPSGVVVSRRHPLTGIDGGSMDHPHHVGLFFAVDNVNGTNFWKNTTTSPQIRHVSIDNEKNPNGEATLVTTSHWIDGSGSKLLAEHRIMRFMASEQATEYAIDFKLTLTALNQKVVFKDTEEGVLAVRLADALRESGARVIPAPGQPLPKEQVTGTGIYFSSNAEETADQVWGERARWVAIQGIKEGKVVGVAILNHPESINYPTYWHARGYGLFSANPLGQGDFQRQSRYKKNPVIPLQLTLGPGESVFFRFRIIIFEGKKSSDQIERRFKAYVSD